MHSTQHISLLLYCRPGVVAAETLIRPEFDGLWSAAAPYSASLSAGRGGDSMGDSVGGGGMGEAGQGYKQTMSKMEKVCVCMNACVCVCFLCCMLKFVHFYESPGYPSEETSEAEGDHHTHTSGSWPGIQGM